MELGLCINSHNGLKLGDVVEILGASQYFYKVKGVRTTIPLEKIEIITDKANDLNSILEDNGIKSIIW